MAMTVLSEKAQYLWREIADWGKRVKIHDPKMVQSAWMLEEIVRLRERLDRIENPPDHDYMGRPK